MCLISNVKSKTDWKMVVPDIDLSRRHRLRKHVDVTRLREHASRMRAFAPEVFSQRRQAFIDNMDAGGVAVFVAPPERQRSHDTAYPYRPSSDIIYFSGFEEPNTVLVLAPGSEAGDFVMFVRPRDEEKETWDGRRFGPEGAKSVYGADEAFSIDDLDKELPKLLEGRDVLYYTLGQHPEFDQRVTGWTSSLRFRRGQPPSAPRAIVDARDIAHEMRILKTDEEIAVMQRSCDIASEAHQLAMRHCTPGMHEFQIQAIIENHFRRNGADFPAYTSIVGGGANATILHYVENRDPLKAGDVLLIDAGCEYGFYASDITRSFPVTGEFTPEQKDVYEAVLEVQKTAIDEAVVGMAYDELTENASRRLAQALSDLKLISEPGDKVYEEGLHKKFYPHKLGHFLGMDVHDVGSYFSADGSWKTLQPGMVITIEPGLYFPANNEDVPEGLRGVGIRIEDDILISESGPINLTESCPKEVRDIEELVGSAGRMES